LYEDLVAIAFGRDFVTNISALSTHILVFLKVIPKQKDPEILAGMKSLAKIWQTLPRNLRKMHKDIRLPMSQKKTIRLDFHNISDYG
jgi:hypothetical protein